MNAVFLNLLTERARSRVSILQDHLLAEEFTEASTVLAEIEGLGVAITKEAVALHNLLYQDRYK